MFVPCDTMAQSTHASQVELLDEVDGASTAGRALLREALTPAADPFGQNGSAAGRQDARRVEVVSRVRWTMTLPKAEGEKLGVVMVWAREGWGDTGAIKDTKE